MTGGLLHKEFVSVAVISQCDGLISDLQEVTMSVLQM